MTVALSFTGDVFGMQQMEVNPPAAAAREPLSMVSAYSKPGSRRWTCMSMKPGATMRPDGVEFGGAGGIEVLADGGDAAVFDRDVAHRVETAGRVHHAAVTNDQVSTWTIQFPRMRSSTAMRTAIPFST